MKNKIFIIFFLISVKSFALEHGCFVHPSQLNEVATKVVQAYSSEEQSVPDSILVQTSINTEINNGIQSTVATVEGFFRPEKTNYFSLWKLPMMGFSLDRDRNLVYICAHIEPNIELSHLTIYFLSGFHLDKTKLSTSIGDLFNEPKLKVQALPITPLNISGARNFWLTLVQNLPESIRKFSILNLLAGSQRLVVNLVSDFSGIGVERIEVTNENIRFSSQINLQNPSETKISKTINLKEESKKLWLR